KATWYPFVLIPGTAVPGILAWYFIFGGLLWQTREKPGIFAVRAGKKPDLVRHNSPNYGGVLFTTPLKTWAKPRKSPVAGRRPSVPIYGGVFFDQRSKRFENLNQ